MHRSRRVIVAVAALSVLSLSACGGSHHSGADSAVTAADSPTANSQGMDPNMPGMNHTGMAGMTMPVNDGDGLSATKDGYTLISLKAPKTAGEAGTLSFAIKGPSGRPHTEFTLQQTKLLHLYVVRKDLTQYQHLHPTLNAKTGVWSVNVTFAEPGPYHVLTEFEALRPDGDFDDRKLGDDFTIPGKYKPVAFSPTYNAAKVGDYKLALDGTPKVGGGDLKLKITKGGADVMDLQPYLASFAHVTGFRKGDLKAVHVHPNETPKAGDANAVGGPVLTLAPMFTEPGTYRLFVQFQTGGQVRVAPLDIEVTKSA
jgi:hypothetical protein